MMRRQAQILLWSSLLVGVSAFVPLSRPRVTRRLFVKSELEKNAIDQDIATDPGMSPLMGNTKIPRTLRIEGQGIPSRQEKVQLLDSSTYESQLVHSWDNDETYQRGFDWEIEKLRRFAAGLRMRSDGTWVKQPSMFDFLVSPSKWERTGNAGPRPAGLVDSVKVFGALFLTGFGFGPALGMAAVPNAVIQKYEGSFFSFITGVLGGDLQTLAGGPLFLLLAKYFQEYGPIFNLSLYVRLCWLRLYAIRLVDSTSAAVLPCLCRRRLMLVVQHFIRFSQPTTAVPSPFW
jgi:hypothetical protein